ncbi:NADH:ubiquinone oxidoreductase [Arthrobotrys megalospora]
MVLRTPSAAFAAASSRRPILQSTIHTNQSRCLLLRPHQTSPFSTSLHQSLKPRQKPSPSTASRQPRRQITNITEPKNESSSTIASTTTTTTTTPPTPKSRFRVLRFLWRLTWLSSLGGAAYLAYHIYDSKHPPEQLPLDPAKKTLVVLGSGWGSISLLKKLDTEDYNVVVISPRNFFLFTPLLPSCTTGTIEHRSIMEPLRHIIRHKKRAVKYYEAEATKIDVDRRVVKINDFSDIKGNVSETEVPFDYLVVGVGAENATFGIPGVRENACFLKEIGDAQQIRKRVMDCIETATFKDQTEEEKDRLLHMVVVGGGPTGIEFAAELQDFFEEDLRKWVPDIADRFKVTLVEALPNVLPMFSKALIEYTEKTFKDENISVRTKTMVKKVTDKNIEVEATQADGSKVKENINYGLLVWATGNAVRGVVRDLMGQLPAQKNSRRGLAVNDYLVVDGTDGIWALGDCSATKYAPTAQVASQQGNFLARLFNSMAKTQAVEEELRRLDQQLQASTDEAEKAQLTAEINAKGRSLSKVKQLSPFEYSHQGSLAYIGADRAVADLNWFGGAISSATGGELTYLFWRSAYVSMVFSLRNRILVLTDWLKTKAFGRDVSRE